MATIRIDDPVYEASALPGDSSLRGMPLLLPGSTTRLMSTRTAQWTKTKMPATSVGQALSNLKGFERLERGIHVMKITTKGRLKKRILTVSEDHFALFVTHSPIKGNKGFTIAKSLGLPFITRKGIRGFNFSSDEVRDDYVRYIDVADIDGMQLGVVGTQKLELARTGVYRLKGEDSQVDKHADQIVSILHHGTLTLDMLVPDKADRDTLVRCVRMMRQTYMAAQKHVSNEDLLLRYIWYDVDTNQNGLIGKTEFSKILKRINLYLKNPDRKFNEYVKELGQDADPQGLTYPQIMTLLQQLKTTGMIEKIKVSQQIWDETFGKNVASVTAEDFLKKFLHKAQDMHHLTITDAKEIIFALNHMEINHANAHAIKDIRPDWELIPARFEAFLFDPMNDAYDPWVLKPGGSLDHPMSQYWINTSHNTYLTGDQLQSQSSVSMYMIALRRGCKCLELDVWDGEMSAKGEPLPIVYHGLTLTSRILFADILRAVKSFMISNPNTYPVILSLENHCSHPFQKAMAKNLLQILGESLYIPLEAERNNDLPSPEALKGKVVIKGKRPPEPDDGEEEAIEMDDRVATTTEKKPKIVPELANLTLFHGVKFKTFEASLNEPPTHMHSIGETKIQKILSKQATNTSLWRQYNTHHMTRTYPAGSRVDSSNYNPITPWATGSQMVALNFQTCDTPLILNDGRFRADRRSGYILKPKSLLAKDLQSDDEDDMMPMLAAEEASVEAPAETVVEASKETPAEATEENQLVALQLALVEAENCAFDYIMGDFEEVLCGERTPDIITHELMVKQPREQRTLVMERIRFYHQNMTNHVNEIRLRVRVVAASCLPKPKGAKSGEHIDPYVEVTLHDMQERGEGKATYLTASFKTNTVPDNGFCPVWNDKAMKEFTVAHPEVAMIHFSVKESDVGIDDRIADAAIPCHRLRTGWRSIQLYDTNNLRTGAFGFATLLVQIQIV
uniref:Phosphoinositide phospholipase C n=1 Tax=Amphora coffeiformis TaxID=265554 RepID=A0A7S3L2L3_9STRA